MKPSPLKERAMHERDINPSFWNEFRGFNGFLEIKFIFVSGTVCKIYLSN
jgi:hypothetical protein